MNDMNELFRKLNVGMLENHVAVNSHTNPVFAVRKKMSKSQIAYVLAQYTLFTKNIVFFLYAARNVARNNKWKSVDVELKRNLGEELGAETECITHNMMLVEGIKESIGIDVSGTNPNSATQKFISEMKKIMGSENVAYSSGGAYALETSAIPELRIIIELVGDLALLERGSSKFSAKLEKFFDGHLNVWEAEHENGLKNACGDYITNDNKDDFSKGFEAVMETMDVWWTGLQKESSG